MAECELELIWHSLNPGPRTQHSLQRKEEHRGQEPAQVQGSEDQTFLCLAFI